MVEMDARDEVVRGDGHYWQWADTEGQGAGSGQRHVECRPGRMLRRGARRDAARCGS